MEGFPEKLFWSHSTTLAGGTFSQPLGQVAPQQCPVEADEVVRSRGTRVTAPRAAVQRAGFEHSLCPGSGCKLPPPFPLRAGTGQGLASGRCPRRGQSCSSSACPRPAIREEEEDAPGTGPELRGQPGPRERVSVDVVWGGGSRGKGALWLGGSVPLPLTVPSPPTHGSPSPLGAGKCRL